MNRPIPIGAYLGPFALLGMLAWFIAAYAFFAWIL